jgi:hypothetical protein
MSIPFDITKEVDKERVMRHVKLLSCRMIDRVEALHYLETEAGFICLDFDLWAATESALDARVCQSAKGIMLGHILPASDTSMWMRMIKSKLKHQRKMYLPGRRMVVISTCTEI